MYKLGGLASVQLDIFMWACYNIITAVKGNL